MKNRITLLLTVLVICLSLPLLTASAEDTHEHDFINGGYVYFQSNEDPGIAGYLNSDSVSWNPAVSHGRVLKCAICGDTDHDNYIWIQDHILTKELSSIRTFSTVINQIQSAQR